MDSDRPQGANHPLEKHPVKKGFLLLAAAMAATSAQAQDYGQRNDALLARRTPAHFGFAAPIPGLATPLARAVGQPASDRQVLAAGLTASYVARNVATDGDMIAFWPNDVSYTHLIVCIEGGRAAASGANPAGYNAGVQRVNVTTGQVETILHGMDRCDGIRTTPWGTIFATEETNDGRGYEILDPIGTTGHWVADRTTGDVRDALNSLTASTVIAQRQALPTMAWEGLAVLETGVVIAGDELRPGDAGTGADGGAIFKFVPATPFACTLPKVGGVCANPIANLASSPFVAGTNFALQTSAQGRTSGSFPQFGQGAEIGEGAWVQVNALTARADANTRGATGYYRPEDLHQDPTYTGIGARVCWTNTGNPAAKNWSEVVCAIDETPGAPSTRTTKVGGAALPFPYQAQSGGAFAVAVVNRLIEGDPRLFSADNLDFQPVSGNVYVIEDETHGEVWACLPDGLDRDIKSDGCVSMLSVRDASAEPTGFIFDGTGQVAYYVVQHGEQPAGLLDFASNPVNGRTDDLIKITGFANPATLIK